MARLTVDFPDAIAPRVLDAWAALYGWTAASGLSKAQFLKQDIIAKIKDAVRRYEGGAAGSAAQKTAHDKAETEITLT